MSWIWTQGHYDREKASFVFFRNEVSIDEEIESAIVRISADSPYRLYANVVSVSPGPSKGDNHIGYYDEVELAEQLRQGVNVFAIIVLRLPPPHDKGTTGFLELAFVGGEGHQFQFYVRSLRLSS